MTTNLTRLQVDRVLGGGDVLGRPFAKPIRFPKDPQKLAILCTWTHDFFTSRLGRLTVAQRTAFIRKFASYMIRTGSWCGVDASTGWEWFRTHPHLLATKLSMASAIKQAREAEPQERDDDGERIRRMRDYARTVPCPPMPVTYRSGSYVLEQLIHPDHLRAVGLEAKNCLAVTHNGAKIANRFYWQAVKKKKRHVFTLRNGGKLCLAFTVGEGRILESEIFEEPDSLRKAFFECIAALQKRFGPIRYLLQDIFWDPNLEFPSRALFWSLMLPLAREIRLALRGAVPGAERKPLPMPTLAVRRRMLSWMKTFDAEVLGCTSHDRIRFARKLSVFLIFNRDANLREYTVLRAIEWFSAHRASLDSPLSLAGASRLHQQESKAHLNAQLKKAHALWHSDIRAPYAPPATVFKRDGYRLERLTHARHLIQTGIKARNCLVQWRGKRPFPHSRFWKQLRDGQRHFFTLSRGDRLLVIFTIVDDFVTGMQHFTPRDDVADVMAACVPAVEAITGRVQPYADELWPRPGEINDVLPFHHLPTCSLPVGSRAWKHYFCLEADAYGDGT